MVGHLVTFLSQCGKVAYQPVAFIIHSWSQLAFLDFMGLVFMAFMAFMVLVAIWSWSDLVFMALLAMEFFGKSCHIMAPPWSKEMAQGWWHTTQLALWPILRWKIQLPQPGLVQWRIIFHGSNFTGSVVTLDFMAFMAFVVFWSFFMAFMVLVVFIMAFMVFLALLPWLVAMVRTFCTGALWGAMAVERRDGSTSLAWLWKLLPRKKYSVWKKKWFNDNLYYHIQIGDIIHGKPLWLENMGSHKGLQVKKHLGNIVWFSNKNGKPSRLEILGSHNGLKTNTSTHDMSFMGGHAWPCSCILPFSKKELSDLLVLVRNILTRTKKK